MGGSCLWRILSGGRGRCGWIGDLGGQTTALTTRAQGSGDNSSKQREKPEPSGVRHGGAGSSHKQMEVPCIGKRD